MSAFAERTFADTSVRLNAATSGPPIKKRQTVMIVTGAVRDWEYLPLTTDQSLERQSDFNGGRHD
jgi:hypothetical protein